MDETLKQQRLETFRRACRERGLPVTVQRRVVLEAVLDLDGHPSADNVHAAVERRHPGISRTTVYRALDTLSRLGVITKVSHSGRMVRYEGRTELHHHLICLRCDQVIDISDERLDGCPLPDTSKHGFEVRDHRVQLRGICRRCRKEEEK